MRALQLIDYRRFEVRDIEAPGAPGPGEVTLDLKVVVLNHIPNTQTERFSPLESGVLESISATHLLGR